MPRVVLVLILLTLGGAVRASPAPPVVVGSKGFTESRILAEVVAQLIETQLEVEVVRKTNLGGTMIVHQALVAGDIDLYPEYTGTAYSAVLGEKSPTSPLQTYTTVARAYRERFGLVWLSPLGFNNTYALGVHQDVAQRLGLSQTSDLGPHLSSLRPGFSHEFLRRDDGWPGLVAAYGFSPTIDPRGIEHGLAYQALADGQVDLIDTYSTDGKIARTPITLLRDDRGFFPPYDGALVVRGQTLRRLPKLRPVLEQLADTLDDAGMQALNAAVDVDRKSYADAARGFLQSARLLEGAAPAPSLEAANDTPKDHVPLKALGARLVEHIWLTALALLLATGAGVPLGLWLTRRRRWAGPLIGAVGIIQTVPSLALLAFMIPIPGLGLGSRSAILALFLYSLLPIVRNTFTGITDVDPDVIDAARGMGLTPQQRLVLVELPLAARAIMAGVRTATVIGIGVATLAAFIGAGGLGEPIITGLQLNDTSLVLQGAIPAALLAVAADIGLGFLERRLRPPG